MAASMRMVPGAAIAPSVGVAKLSSSFQGMSLRCAAPASSSVKLARSVTVCGIEAGVGVFGNKAGMTQIFSGDKAIPVTVIAIGEGNVVTQIKTAETDGYEAVQIGYKEVAERKLTQPEIGHLKKSSAKPLRYLAEWRLRKVEGFELGQQLSVEEMFKVGDLVDVRGKSIGKGFQGAIKRHNYHRGLMTHGSKSHRELGTTGPGTTPGRVYPGKGEPGQMGNYNVMVRKLEVVRVDAENRYILVKGTVPGKPGNLLRVSPAKIVGKNV